MSTATQWRIGVLGWVWVRPTAVPAVLLVVVLGRRLVSGGARWIPCCAVATFVIVVEALRQPHVFGGVAGLAGFALSALQEEVAFRVALPLAVWTLLQQAGVRPAIARLTTLFAAAALFAVQPNHVAQGTWPFFAFALLFCLCVRRIDALVPAALAHLAYNLLSVGTLYGQTDGSTRAAGVVAVLGSFILTAYLMPRPAAAVEHAPTNRFRRYSDWSPALDRAA